MFRVVPAFRLKYTFCCVDKADQTLANGRVPRIQIKVRDTGLPKELSLDAIDKSKRRAAKRTAITGRTLATRQIAKEAGLKVSVVRRSVRSQGSQIIGEGGIINLGAFAARRRRRGISARPYGRRRLFRGAFFIGAGVFRREPDGQNPNRPGKLTKHSQRVRPLGGPGIANTFRTIVESPTWQTAVADRYQQVLKQEFNFRTKKARR